MNESIKIDAALVKRLITVQFPEWQDLTIRQVIPGGWDNRTFRLGEEMLVRMPSAHEYALKVEKEQEWLPRLAPYLPLPIPMSIAMGYPGDGYPWNWSIYQWIEGETAATASISDLCLFARDLAQFLLALHKTPVENGLCPGKHNFYRGGSLKIYDAETRQALAVLNDKINITIAKEIWELGLSSIWHKEPVWVHGDVSVGNLLVQGGKLCGVIDFGGIATGDPACDLVMAWTFFQGQSRKIFQETLKLDANTWARARRWALWKALIVAAKMTESNAVESEYCFQILAELMGAKEI